MNGLQEYKSSSVVEKLDFYAKYRHGADLIRTDIKRLKKLQRVVQERTSQALRNRAAGTVSATPCKSYFWCSGEHMSMRDMNKSQYSLYMRFSRAGGIFSGSINWKKDLITQYANKIMTNYINAI